MEARDQSKADPQMYYSGIRVTYGSIGLFAVHKFVCFRFSAPFRRQISVRHGTNINFIYAQGDKFVSFFMPKAEIYSDFASGCVLGCKSFQISVYDKNFIQILLPVKKITFRFRVCRDFQKNSKIKRFWQKNHPAYPFFFYIRSLIPLSLFHDKEYSISIINIMCYLKIFLFFIDRKNEYPQYLPHHKKQINFVGKEVQILELAERKEKKQKELESLILKHKNLMRYIAELKKKNSVLDQEIAQLEERKAVLQNRLYENRVADEFDQYKEAFRPEKSFPEMPEPAAEAEEPLLEPAAAEKNREFLTEPDEDPEEELQPLPEGLQEELPEWEQDQSEEPEALEDEASMEGLPDSAVMPVIMSQKELLELVLSIRQHTEPRPVEEIIVRNVSAGAKILEILQDAAGKIGRLFIFGLLMLLVSLAATVLINADLRNTLLEFLKNTGV